MPINVGLEDFERDLVTIAVEEEEGMITGEEEEMTGQIISVAKNGKNQLNI